MSTNILFPRVSVIIPSYQGEKTLSRAINSVLMQDYTNFEVILVDNGSTDFTSNVIQKAEERDQRIRSVRLEANQYPAGGRNAGVNLARGEYIAFLDADDEWLPGKLAIQASLLDKFPKYDLVFTDSWIVYLESGKKYRHSSGNEAILNRLIFSPLNNYEDTYSVSGPVTQAIYTKSFINMSTSLLRRAKFLETGGFNPDRFGTEDIDFWVRFSRKSTFIYWHHPTALCYQGEGTSKPGERWLLELIRYHRECLVSPEYAGLEKVSKQNLEKIYRYLIVEYGLIGKSKKAAQTYIASINIGFNFRLCLYTVLAFLGPLPFRIGQWYTSTRKRDKDHSKIRFLPGENDE